MADALATILALVSEGRLSAADAAPLVKALLAGDPPTADPPPADAASASRGAPGHVRVTVTDGGRTVVNLRVPVALGRAAVGLVPGLSLGESSRLEAALAAGRVGPLLDVSDEDGDGVRVLLE